MRYLLVRKLLGCCTGPGRPQLPALYSRHRLTRQVASGKPGKLQLPPDRPPQQALRFWLPAANMDLVRGEQQEMAD